MMSLVISFSNHESQEFGYSLVGNVWERNCFFWKAVIEDRRDMLYLF